MMQHAEGPSPDSVDDEVDERVVSVLLETTGEADNESQPVVAKKVGPRTSLDIILSRKAILTRDLFRLDQSLAVRPRA